MNETEISADGVTMHTWRAVRKQQMRKLRKQTRSIVLFMALTEAMRVGPVQIAMAGREGYPPPGPQDYGISYNIGHFLSWLYCCLFAVVWVPFFSWWVSESKEDLEKPGTMSRIAEALRTFNLILLPLTTYLCLAQWFYHLVCTFIFVDAREVDSRAWPKNTRKNWLVRLLLFSTVWLSLSTGLGVFYILNETGLANVKMLEYLILVMPIQVNIGLVFGSIAQYRVEQRAARKALEAKTSETETALAADEKQALLME